MPQMQIVQVNTKEKGCFISVRNKVGLQTCFSCAVVNRSKPGRIDDYTAL